MKITKAYYFHTFPNPTTGQWQKVGLEGELSEGDDYRKCLYELKKYVTDFYYESNKAAEKENAVVKALSDMPYNGASLISDIYSCTDLKVLKSYEIIIRNKPELQAAYNQQLKKLSNETSL